MREMASILRTMLVLCAIFNSVAAGSPKDSSTVDTVTPEGYNSPIKKYTEFFEGGATAHEVELMNWLLEHGFKDSGLVYQRDEGVRGRGMEFKRAAEKGDELFAVPVELMVYTSNPKFQESTKKALEVFRESFRMPGSVRDDFELTEMALIVMFERRNPHSFFKPYLQMLQFPLCPAFYSDEKMSMFEYAWLKDWRLYFMSDAVKNFDLLLERPEFKLLKSQTIKEEFMWAVSTVLQRSFDWGPDARREYVMVPYLDMINHEQNISNAYYYSHGPLKVRKPTGNVVPEPIKRSMVVAADSSKVQGDGVFISYSRSSSNVQMLLQYGFVVKDNPNDYIVLQLKAPEGRPDYNQVIKELGGVLGSVSITSEYGIPQDFIKAVALVETGTAELVPQAYETVKAAVQQDLDSFSTTLEEDLRLLSSGDLDRLDFTALAYRVEAKKLLREVIKRADVDIALVKEGKQPGPSDTRVRRDWPMRHVVVQPTTAHDPPEEVAAARAAAAQAGAAAAGKDDQDDSKKEL